LPANKFTAAFIIVSLGLAKFSHTAVSAFSDITVLGKHLGKFIDRSEELTE
jgi:hypothetical protein